MGLSARLVAPVTLLKVFFEKRHLFVRRQPSWKRTFACRDTVRIAFHRQLGSGDIGRAKLDADVSQARRRFLGALWISHSQVSLVPGPRDVTNLEQDCFRPSWLMSAKRLTKRVAHRNEFLIRVDAPQPQGPSETIRFSRCPIQCDVRAVQPNR